MSNYVITTSFTDKDSLAHLDPDKVIKGAEFGTEFSNIAAAITSKADAASASLTGTPTAPTATAGTNTTQVATTAFVAAAITANNTVAETLTNKTLTSPTMSGVVLSDGSIVFEGATANDYETTLTVTDPTADRTITLPDATTTLVGTDTTQTLTNKTITGKYYSAVNAAAALDIDCSLGNVFTKTIGANSTFTFSNAPSSVAYGFMLELTHTAGTVTWPTSVKWPYDTVPTLTAGKTHLFVFITNNSGTRWRGAALVDYVN